MSRRFTQTQGKHMGGLGLYSSGNAWTEKDREDLFTRRKAGEDWVSICQDYPNRSIRALEQQCSLFGRKNGIPWTTSTPAKRKSSERREQPSRAASSAPRLATTSGESPGANGSPFNGPTHLASMPMQDVLLSTPAGPESMNSVAEVAPTSNSIPRSIETTQDVKPEPKPAGPVSSVATPFFHETGEGATMTDTTMSNSEAPPPTMKQPRTSRPYKRRKKSPVPSYRNFMVRTADQLIQPEISLEEMPFDKTDLDDIQAAVHTAQTQRQAKFNAQLHNHATAVEKMKKNYEAALARANRRAFEANERYRVAIHDFATLKKTNKIDIAESIASVRAEMTEEHAKALEAKEADTLDTVMAVNDSDLRATGTAVGVTPIEGAIPAPANDPVNDPLDGRVAVPSNDPADDTITVITNDLTNGPADSLTDVPTDGPTDALTADGLGNTNGLVNGPATNEHEVANLQTAISSAAQTLKQEQLLREKENLAHSETITRLTNEVQSLKNAQTSSQLETMTNEKMAEDLKDFTSLKEDIMQLARQFPNVFSIDPNAEWSSAKIGIALHDLVHSRLKQEAQVKVHELLDHC